MRQYSTLTKDDVIPISYNNKIYRLRCLECKPADRGISIVETDLEVDFAPPVGYKEPEPQAFHHQQSSASIVSVCNDCVFQFNIRIER